MVPADSQQLRAQDSAPARLCRTEGRTGHQGQEGGNGDGNRDEGRDGNEKEDGKGHKDRDRGENRSRNRDESRQEGGGGREPGNLRNGKRGGSEDARGVRHQRVANSPSRKTRRPSEAVIPCGGPEPKDRGGGTGSGRGRWEEVQQTLKVLLDVLGSCVSPMCFGVQIIIYRFYICL